MRNKLFIALYLILSLTLLAETTFKGQYMEVWDYLFPKYYQKHVFYHQLHSDKYIAHLINSEESFFKQIPQEKIKQISNTEGYKSDLKHFQNTFTEYYLNTKTYHDHRSITDKEIEKYFKAHTSELKTTENIEVQILFKEASSRYLTESERGEKYQEIQKYASEISCTPEKFTDYVLKFSNLPNTAKNNGMYTFYRESKYNPILKKAAFELKRDGVISKIIETEHGFYLIKRIRYQAQNKPDLKKQRNQIIKILQKEKAQHAQEELKQIVSEKYGGDYYQYAEDHELLTDAKCVKAFEIFQRGSLIDYYLRKKLINKITEDEIKAYYQQHIDTFGTYYLVDFWQAETKLPEKRENQAEYYYAKKDLRQTFEKLRKEIAQKVESERGKIHKNIKTLNLPIVQREFLESAQPGELSPIIESSTHYSLLKLLKRSPKQYPSLDKKRTQIKAMLLDRKIVEAILSPSPLRNP